MRTRESLPYVRVCACVRVACHEVRIVGGARARVYTFPNSYSIFYFAYLPGAALHDF